MKTKIKLISLIAALSMLLLTGFSSLPNDYSQSVSSLQPQLIGAKAAKADTSLTLEDMLTYAIQDEYLARAKYQLVVEKFGPQRPFTNIIRAENNHINALTPLFQKYNFPIPPDNAGSYVTAPATLRQGFEEGVQGEIENIEMYNRFLTQNIPEDVRRVFTNLRNASQNHLRAFQRGLNR